LGWSWRIGAQGGSACFQIVAHKNLDSFDRGIFRRTASPASPTRLEPVDSGIAAE
jgi:hypothetical protein